MKSYNKIRQKVLERDEYKCRRCTRSGRVSVHHLDESGQEYYYKRANNNLNNLITLCPSCHSKLHADLSKKRGRNYLYA